MVPNVCIDCFHNKGLEAWNSCLEACRWKVGTTNWFSSHLQNFHKNSHLRIVCHSFTPWEGPAPSPPSRRLPAAHHAAPCPCPCPCPCPAPHVRRSTSPCSPPTPPHPPPHSAAPLLPQRAALRPRPPAHAPCSHALTALHVSVSGGGGSFGGGVLRIMAQLMRCGCTACGSDGRGVISSAAWPSNLSRRVFLTETFMTRSVRQRCCPSQLTHQSQTAIFMWPAMEWLVLGYRLAGPKAGYSISNFQSRGSTGHARVRHIQQMALFLCRWAAAPRSPPQPHSLTVPRIAWPQILPALRAPS
jgi:hypothetical protein